MNTNNIAYKIWLTVSQDTPNKIQASTQKKIQDVLDIEVNKSCLCPNCKSIDVVEFIGKNRRSCQICGHSWKPRK